MMRKAVLYIAMSLDGYIADENGGVDWLAGQDPGSPAEDSYARFIQGVDTVIMGWNTYRQVTAELSPGHWPYEKLQAYVLTHRQCPNRGGITFLSQEPGLLVRKLKEAPGKDIWICGGAALVRQVMDKGQIDRYHISIIPILLGKGLRLFDSREDETRLRLLEAGQNNGILELIYEKR